MNKTDLLILLVGFLAGLAGTLLLVLISAFVISKRHDDEAERFYLELQDERRELSQGFVHSQRHTAWDQ